MESLLRSLDEKKLKNLLIYNKVNSCPEMKSLAEDLFSLQMEFSDKILAMKISKLNSEIDCEFDSLVGGDVKTNELIKNYNLLKEPKKPVRIYMDGVFDIIHSGHFNAIRQSKKLGDILVVGVNSDEEVEKSKGPTLMNGKERVALARACKWVDEVIEDTPYTPTVELLDKLNIDYCAHGDDMPTNSQGIGCYDEIKKAGRLKIFKRTEGISTTEIIGRLLMFTKESDRNNHNFENLPKTSSEFVKEIITDAESQDFNKGPVMSSFLSTGWRMIEFCNYKTPKPEDKIVYLDGAFDILHIGHIEMLKKAKEYGDFLYVGIHDDQVVHSYLGKNCPILNLQERVFNLLALKDVDDVVIGAPLKITEDLIRSLKINIVLCVKKTHHQIQKNPEKILVYDDPYEVPKSLGIYQEINYEFDLNNEILVQRILQKRKEYVKKYINKSQKEEIYYKKEKAYIEEI